MRPRITRGRSNSLGRSLSEPENPAVVDAELAKGKFSFIYRASVQEDIKVKHCVPLFQTRALCTSAVRALANTFDVDESGIMGYSYAGGMKVVVKIPDEELRIVKRYLLQQNRSETEAQEMAFERGILWYGIVDGLHTQKGLSELERVRPDPFHEFKRAVTVIKWQSISVLKAFSRARNMLQSFNTVEVTLYDTISGIREIALEKANLAGEPLETFVRQRGVITSIADEFCGGSKYSRQTTRTLVGAALRMKAETLLVLCSIMTEENTSLARKVLKRNSSEVIQEEDVFDARAFKSIISTNTVRGAAAFLNADFRDQCNSVLRLKSIFEGNNFKSFQAAHLNRETERSERARRQISLMNNLMGRSRWPRELVDLEMKLSTTSVFDSELDQAEFGKSTDKILESLITEYKKRMPLEAGLRCRLYSRAQRSMLASNASNGTVNEPSLVVNDDQVALPSDTQVSAPAEVQTHSVEAVPAPVCPLQQLDVECLNMTLERYFVRRKSNEEKFDIVTGDPSQVHINGTCKVVIDDRQADNYVGILKQLIRPHGWVFFYTSAVDYGMWFKAFQGNGFKPLAYPWIMVRDTSTTQMNTSPIPQSVSEIVIGARKVGTGRPEHQPDINSTYKRPVSTRKRKFAIMDSCAEPRLKLKKPNSREPLRTNQRSQEPMAEFLDTFCPENGLILDAFAGSMETAKACVMTGRKCVVLEADSLCFPVAFGNLKEFATQYLHQNATAFDGANGDVSSFCNAELDGSSDNNMVTEGEGQPGLDESCRLGNRPEHNEDGDVCIGDVDISDVSDCRTISDGSDSQED